jgi:hypothetical protein
MSLSVQNCCPTGVDEDKIKKYFSDEFNERFSSPKDSENCQSLDYQIVKCSEARKEYIESKTESLKKSMKRIIDSCNQEFDDAVNSINEKSAVECKNIYYTKPIMKDMLEYEWEEGAAEKNDQYNYDFCMSFPDSLNKAYEVKPLKELASMYDLASKEKSCRQMKVNREQFEACHSENSWWCPKVSC